MEISVHSTEETKKLAERLADDIKPGDILALFGDLGSGKTTFTGFLVKALGFSDRVQSPTFVIMRHYKNGSGKSLVKEINHLDLYRIRTEEELDDLGINELFEKKDTLTLIEWPELLNLPAHSKKLYFEYVSENERKIEIK